MPLVTIADVRLIVNTILSDASITACIQTADITVMEDLAATALSIPRKTEIERYLAAHYAALADNSLRTTRERVGELQVEYSHTNMINIGLEYTRYGQAAMSLDKTGTLRRYSKNGTAKFSVMHSKDMNAENLYDLDIIS